MQHSHIASESNGATTGATTKDLGDSTIPQSLIADKWGINESANLYNIKGWGDPYFGINSKGHVTVSPQGAGGRKLDLRDTIELLQQQGLKPPLLIYFPEILVDRLKRLHGCMAEAIARYGYQGHYRGVFPIKCNHNPQLIETLVDAGKPYNFGLEVGSKAELAIALAALSKLPNTSLAPLLMCNGYKDRGYVTMALLATKLGQSPMLVIEQVSELELILALSRELGITPVLGVRVKLSAPGIGRWSGTTGEHAKFGLTVREVLQVLQRLSELNQLSALQLLHFHIGSQISAIGIIKDALREASQIYVQLVQMGAPMGYLNVGGGLAVDYDGSKSNAPASKNYNMQNYANDVVAQIKDACDQAGVAHPILISESGRAITAHQGVLVLEVLAGNEVSCPNVVPPKTDAPLPLKNFWETYQEIKIHNLQESYHDAIQFKQEALSLFNLGYLDLAERVQAESLYQKCCFKIASMLEQMLKQSEVATIPEELVDLNQALAATYYVNMSIFRSIPDAWAIGQLFPIMPLQRLAEQPYVKGVLADITCDSDGKIEHFINPKNNKSLLELHSLSAQDLSEGYFLGTFLVGAYQEILGNLHNLFGKVSVVHLATATGGLEILANEPNDTIEEILTNLRFDTSELKTIIGDRLEQALREQSLEPAQAQKIIDSYNQILQDSSYLS